MLATVAWTDFCKKGCKVECGACTVIIDGETIDSYLSVAVEVKYPYTEGLEKTENLPGFRRHLSKKVPAVRFLNSQIYHVCHCFTGTWREKSIRCDQIQNIWQEISAVQVMRTL